MGILLQSIPTGSVQLLPDEGVRLSYLQRALETPTALRKLLFTRRTGAYLTGMAKHHRLDPNQTPIIAFIVLRVGLGEIHMAQLSSALSSELKLPNDRAQAIARELEKDLFAPVAMDLSQAQQLKQDQQANESETRAQQAGARNVLNLKRQTPAAATRRPPTPPQLPRQK